jgi:hypothetical protein
MILDLKNCIALGAYFLAKNLAIFAEINIQETLKNDVDDGV